MNEKKLQKRIVKITILTAAVSLLLLACSCIVIYYMTTAERTSYQAQMQAFINEYKINIERQFDSDMGALETLAGFISDSRILTLENMDEGITENSGQTMFLRLGYCEKDSDELRISLSKNMGDALSLSEQNEQVQTIIRKAWEGESVTSYMYMDEILQQWVIAYAVPVYDNDTIMGSLLGVKNLDAFEELLNRTTLSQISMDVDWVNQNGEYITWSSDSFIKASMGNIFNTQVLSEKEKAVIREKMAAGEPYTTEFENDGKNYPLYFEPLDRNGWYLVCTDKTSEIRSPVYFRFLIVIVTFFIILALSIFSILYGARYLRKNNRQLIGLAYYDPLTGSYNLPRFRQEIQELLKDDSVYSIAIINIRHFRYMNEIFGREQANGILKGIAGILKQNIRENERYCRYMADEFYILLNTDDQVQARERVMAIMNQVGTLSENMNRTYPITLYGGIAVNPVTLPKNADDVSAGKAAETLIHRGEFALKHARMGQDNTVVFYDESIYQAENLQNQIESDMKRALSEGEFKLYLQPKKNLNTGKIQAAEALVRWIRNDGTMIYPDQFIPIFEKNGFCAELDLYMVELVCRQLRQWMDAGYEPMTVSINQSKLLFYRSDYVQKLCQITDQYQIPRTLIVMEILEGLAAESIEELNKNISVLHEKGFKISLDDFGSGYSSLNLLARLEIDEVKLDRGFLAGDLYMENEKLKVLMKNIIRLAEDLHIDTVVEGVESGDNESFISRIGAAWGQGYYYSRPISAADFEKMYLEKEV